MRFLLDVHQLGRRKTGNETWVRNLVQALSGLAPADEIHYAVSAQGLSELRRLTDAPARPVGDGSLRRLTLDLPRMIHDVRPHAVFSTYTSPLTRRPKVLMLHDASPWDPQAGQWLRSRARIQYRATMGLSARTAAIVLTPSRSTRNQLIERLGLDESRVIHTPLAVDIELQRLMATAPRPPDDGELRVLFVGNVLPRKNLILLGHAVKACGDVGVSVQLRIVGEVTPEGRHDAEELSVLLGPRLHMLGYLSPAELATEYLAATVMAFPSFVEGFGLPMLESMAAGTPVVASNTTSLPEVAGGAAILCPPDDIAAWRDALLRIHNEVSTREDLRRRGYERVAEFSWESTARTVLVSMRLAATADPTAHVNGRNVSAPRRRAPRSSE